MSVCVGGGRGETVKEEADIVRGAIAEVHFVSLCSRSMRARLHAARASILRAAMHECVRRSGPVGAVVVRRHGRAEQLLRPLEARRPCRMTASALQYAMRAGEKTGSEGVALHRRPPRARAGFHHIDQSVLLAEQCAA